jgi:hypothetical protein
MGKTQGNLYTRWISLTILVTNILNQTAANKIYNVQKINMSGKEILISGKCLKYN